MTDFGASLLVQRLRHQQRDLAPFAIEMFNRSVHITVPQGFCRVPDSQESGRTRR